jgi:rubredoxin
MSENVTQQKWDSLQQAVGESLGAASVCWENPGGAGVFQDGRAKQVLDDLVAWIETHYTANEAEQIICPACAKAKAVAQNYVMNPETKNYWRCTNCGYTFEAKDHA